MSVDLWTFEYPPVLLFCFLSIVRSLGIRSVIFLFCYCPHLYMPVASFARLNANIEKNNNWQSMWKWWIFAQYYMCLTFSKILINYNEILFVTISYGPFAIECYYRIAGYFCGYKFLRFSHRIDWINFCGFYFCGRRSKRNNFCGVDPISGLSKGTLIALSPE